MAHLYIPQQQQQQQQNEAVIRGGGEGNLRNFNPVVSASSSSDRVAPAPVLEPRGDKIAKWASRSLAEFAQAKAKLGFEQRSGEGLGLRWGGGRSDEQ